MTKPKKKVLFITENSFSLISDLLYYVQEFTIHNGCYPDIIEMEKEGFNKYCRFLIPPYDIKKITFHGIRVINL